MAMLNCHVNPKYYCEAVEKVLLTQANNLHGNTWRIVRNSVRVHCLEYTTTQSDANIVISGLWRWIAGISLNLKIVTVFSLMRGSQIVEKIFILHSSISCIDVSLIADTNEFGISVVYSIGRVLSYIKHEWLSYIINARKLCLQNMFCIPWNRAFTNVL